MTGRNRAGNTLLKVVGGGPSEQVTLELGQNQKTAMQRYRKRVFRKERAAYAKVLRQRQRYLGLLKKQKTLPSK